MVPEDPRSIPEPEIIDLDGDGLRSPPITDPDRTPRATRDRKLVVVTAVVLAVIVAGATFLGDADDPDESGPTEDEAATTSEEPDGPPPEPGIDVEPTTDLADGDTLTLTLTPPPVDLESRPPAVSMCPPSDRSDEACLPLHAENAITGERSSTVEVVVPRLLPAVSGAHDCATAGPCELHVSAGGVDATIALDFDPDRFLIPVVAPRLTDTRPVASGDQVTIIRLDATVVDRVDQCVTGLADRCDGFGTYDQGYNPFPNDHFVVDAGTLRVRVFRRILTPDGIHDCLEDSPCELRIRSRVAAPRVQPVLVTFDPTAPADPSPVVRASPTSALTDGERVQVVIDGLGPHSTYTVTLCPADPRGDEACPVLLGTEASEHGTDIVSLALSRRVATSLRDVDCAEERCVLRIAEGRFRTEVPVDFDPTAPLGPDPTFEVDPAGPTTVGDRVVLRGSGLPVANPRQAVTAWWALCDRRPSGPAEIDARCGSPRDVQPSSVSPDGAVALTVIVPRPSTIRTWDGTQRLECSTCWLLVSTDTTVTTFGTPITIR